MSATSLGALYQLVIQPSPSASSAITLVNRLAAKILTAPQLKLSLADQLAILATAVHDRQHLVQAGASAEDAVILPWSRRISSTTRGAPRRAREAGRRPRATNRRRLSFWRRL